MFQATKMGNLGNPVSQRWVSTTPYGHDQHCVQTGTLRFHLRKTHLLYPPPLPVSPNQREALDQNCNASALSPQPLPPSSQISGPRLLSSQPASKNAGGIPPSLLPCARNTQKPNVDDSAQSIDEGVSHLEGGTFILGGEHPENKSQHCASLLPNNGFLICFPAASTAPPKKTHVNQVQTGF